MQIEELGASSSSSSPSLLHDNHVGPGFHNLLLPLTTPIHRLDEDERTHFLRPVKKELIVPARVSASVPRKDSNLTRKGLRA